MTARNEYSAPTLRLIDAEGRWLATAEDVFFDIEFDDVSLDCWIPVRATWTIGGQQYQASYRDADQATWRLLLSSWDAAELGTKMREIIGEPMNETEDAA